MEGGAVHVAGDGAVRADDPEIESQLLNDGQSELVAASSDDDDFDTKVVGTTQGEEVGFRDLKLGIEKSAVNINGEKTDGRRDHR
jgi:hypothetical protein